MGAIDASSRLKSEDPHMQAILIWDIWNQVGARTLLGLLVATRNKKLLGASGLTTRSKDAMEP